MLAGKTQERRGEGRAGPETFEHGLARHMVVSTDSVDGRYSSAGVQSRGRVEEFVKALHACPRAQP